MFPLLKIQFLDNDTFYLARLRYDADNRLHVAFGNQEDMEHALSLLPCKLNEINLSNNMIECTHDEQYLYTVIESNYEIVLTNDKKDKVTKKEKSKVDKNENLVLIQEITANISVLSSELASTDYKFVKAYECSILGENYDKDELIELHSKRDQLRAQIKELQGELEKLSIQ